MAYTTTDAKTNVEWIYTSTATNALPKIDVGYKLTDLSITNDSLVYKPLDMLITNGTMPNYVRPRDKYICNYCGTRFVTDENGFVPNCKNCGAKMDRDKDET